jgi:hypothetical protein
MLPLTDDEDSPFMYTEWSGLLPPPEGPQPEEGDTVHAPGVRQLNPMITPADQRGLHSAGMPFACPRGRSIECS